MLLGWLGADRKHVAKYAEAWRAPPLGLVDVVDVVPGVAATLFERAADAAHLEALRRVTRETAAGAPLVLHAFSNAGELFLGGLMRRADGGCELARDVLGRTAGVVLDSAPGRLDVDVVERGVSATLLGVAAPPRGDPLRVPGARLAASALLAANAERLEAVRSAWDTALPGVPTLLLHTKADTLIPAEFLEAFAARREAGGAPVRTRAWDDPPHCEILRYHRDEYVHELASWCEEHGLLRPV